MDAMSDDGSIRTEDFAYRFQETVVPTAGVPVSSKRLHDRSPAMGRSAEFLSESPQEYGHLSSSRPWRSQSALGSLANLPEAEGRCDSVRTEEFENQFQQVMVSQRRPPRGPSPGELPCETTSGRLRQLGSLASIPAMRRDIMSKFLEKYGDRDVDPRVSTRRSRSRSPDQAIGSPLPRARQNVSFRAYPGRLQGVLTQCNPIPEKRVFSNEEISAQIRIKTEQIKKEIQSERRRRHSGTGLTPREAFDQKVIELDNLTSSVKRANSERENLSKDLSLLEDNLRRYQAEVRLSKKLAQDSRTKAEDLRKDLMLSEIKRDNTRRDLDLLNDELIRKKQQLKDMERKMKERIREIRDLETDGLSREEIEAVIAERNELYELLKASEENENAKYELEKKLSVAEVNLSQEQQRSREAIVSLEEELEASFGKIAELRREKEDSTERLNAYETKTQNLGDRVASLETENHDLRSRIEASREEHSQELRKLREKLDVDSKKSQEGQTEQQSHLRQLQELNDRLHVEIDEHQKNTQKLREQQNRMQYELDTVNTARERVIAEYEERIMQSEKEKEREMATLKDQFSSHKVEEISEMRKQLDQEKAKTIAGMKEWYQKHLKELEETVQQKEEEISYLKSHIRHQESNFAHATKEHEIESREKIRDILRRERANWERQLEDRWKKDLDSIKDETTGVIKALQEEVMVEKENAKALEESLEQTKEELKEQKKVCATVLHEKQLAVQQLGDDSKSQIENLEKHYKEEMESKLQKVMAQLEEKEAALAEMEKEVDELEKQSANRLKSLCDSVVCEIDEECKKIANLVLAEPPRFDSEKEKLESEDPSAAVPGALANLQACVEELPVYFKKKIDTANERIKEVEKEKSEEIEELRCSFREEKTKELSDFKNQLMKEHLAEIERLSKTPDPSIQQLLREKEEELRELTMGMKRWKEETADWLATKLQAEFRREYEKKLRNVKAACRGQRGSGERADVEATHTSESIKMISTLKDRVKKLREENMSLRKMVMGKSSGSVTPDQDLSDDSIAKRRYGTNEVEDDQRRLTTLKKTLVNQCDREIQRPSGRDSSGLRNMGPSHDKKPLDTA